MHPDKTEAIFSLSLPLSSFLPLITSEEGRPLIDRESPDAKRENSKGNHARSNERFKRTGLSRIRESAGTRAGGHRQNGSAFFSWRRVVDLSHAGNRKVRHSGRGVIVYSRWPVRCITIILLCLREFLVGVWRPEICEAAKFTGTVVDRQFAIDGARPSSFSLSLRPMRPMLPVDTAPVDESTLWISRAYLLNVLFSLSLSLSLSCIERKEVQCWSKCESDARGDSSQLCIDRGISTEFRDLSTQRKPSSDVPPAARINSLEFNRISYR